MNNIAEGFERSTDAEFARTAEDLAYIDPTTADARRVRAKQIAAGIAALTSHLRQ